MGKETLIDRSKLTASLDIRTAAVSKITTRICFIVLLKHYSFDGSVRWGSKERTNIHLYPCIKMLLSKERQLAALTYNSLHIRHPRWYATLCANCNHYNSATNTHLTPLVGSLSYAAPNHRPLYPHPHHPPHPQDPHPSLSASHDWALQW